eukprot:scpid11838/ scgid7902/ 
MIHYFDKLYSSFIHLLLWSSSSSLCYLPVCACKMTPQCRQHTHSTDQVRVLVLLSWSWSPSYRQCPSVFVLVLLLLFYVTCPVWPPAALQHLLPHYISRTHVALRPPMCLEGCAFVLVRRATA